jgi:hypothetical protein
MTTQNSIHAKGISFDVLDGTTVECINEAKLFFQENFNTPIEPTVKSLGEVTIEEVEYNLYECYVDSGSDDYYYFSVKK